MKLQVHLTLLHSESAYSDTIEANRFRIADGLVHIGQDSFPASEVKEVTMKFVQEEQPI